MPDRNHSLPPHEKKDVRIEDERIAEIAENGQITATDEDVIDGEGMYAIPGLVDIHFQTYDLLYKPMHFL